MSDNIWQVCPKCDGGRGVLLLEPRCSVCKGEEIISKLTGKPPSSIQENLTEYIDDQLKDITELLMR